jgi:hypothetical protein
MRFRVPEFLLGVLFAIAVFAMGMLFAPLHNSHPSSQNPTQYAETAVQNESTGKAPPANGSHAGQDHEQQETKGEFWSAKLSDWVLVAFTGLLVLFTYRLWKSTDKLWEAGERQIDLTRKMTGAAIDSTEHSRSSAEIAAKQFETSFRPWLLVRIKDGFVDGEQLRRFKADERMRLVTFSAHIEITNKGDMPAVITAISVEPKMATGGTTTIIDSPNLYGPQPKTRLFIELTKDDSHHPFRVMEFSEVAFPEDPRLGAPSVGFFEITAENRRQFMSADIPLIGKIEYMDVIGKRRELGFAFNGGAIGGHRSERWGGPEYNYDRDL